MIYTETFDNGPGGWYGFVDNFRGIKALAVKDGVAWSYSPWWVDYNHAPPGAGYLQLLMGLNTRGPFGEAQRELAGVNRFVAGGFPTNFTNARFTVRLRGELETRGAQLVLLVQGTVDGICSGWLLTGQPLRVTTDWSEQCITVVADPAQWTCLGSRHDRTDMYGHVDLNKILTNVNTNFYFVMFPVNAVSMGPIAGDPHRLRAGHDYPLWLSRLPEGYVGFDTVTVEFP
jgi:hypothetical protein